MERYASSQRHEGFSQRPETMFMQDLSSELDDLILEQNYYDQWLNNLFIRPIMCVYFLSNFPIVSLIQLFFVESGPSKRTKQCSWHGCQEFIEPTQGAIQAHLEQSHSVSFQNKNAIKQCYYRLSTGEQCRARPMKAESLVRHIRTVSSHMSVHETCPRCRKRLSRNDTVDRHLTNKICRARACRFCGVYCTDRKKRRVHEGRCPRNPGLLQAWPTY